MYQLRVLLLALFLPALWAQTTNPPTPPVPAPTSQAEASPGAAQNLADSVLGTTLRRDQIWAPPTTAQRWQVYRLRSFTGPGAYIRTLSVAASDQQHNLPSSWGQGWDAYGKRVLNRYATFQLQDATEAGLSALASYDPRYIQCRCTNFWSRIGHAALWDFVTYDRNGKTVFNWPKFASAYGIGMLATTYTPETKWSAEGVRNGNTQVSFGILANILKEFSPDLIRKFRKPKP
jgi:hypothetical protein